MNETKKYYAVQQIDREAHVYIFGDIVAWKLFDDETSAYSFKTEINALDVDVIHVHINSYGGSVSEGWAIYNTLRDHPARIVTHGDGFVASAALYPFMAGDERIASNLSTYFFHQVLIGSVGNADELRKSADEAEKLTEIGLAAFTNAGIPAERVRELMKAETWLDATEALEQGFATSIVADEAPQEQQRVKRAIMQRVTAPKSGCDGAETAPAEKTPTPAPENGPEAAQGGEKQTNGVMALYKNFKF